MKHCARCLFVVFFSAVSMPAMAEDFSEITQEMVEEIELPAAQDPNAEGYAPTATSPRRVDISPVVAEDAVAAAPTIAPQARDIPLIEENAEVRSHSDVSFVTGGIGEDEKQSIEAARGDYNLHVMNAGADGAFVGGARVVISRKVGKNLEEMLSVSAGPLLYVRLPSGSYMLEATLGSQTKKQPFTVHKKGAAVPVHLGWKQGS